MATVSYESADAWPRARRHRRHRRSSLFDDAATTVSNDLANDLIDTGASRQQLAETASDHPARSRRRLYATTRSDSGDLRRVYFDRRSSNRSPARSTRSTRSTRSYSFDEPERRSSRRERPVVYVSDRPARSFSNPRSKKTYLAALVGDMVENLLSAVGPATVCSAFNWMQIATVVVGLLVGVVYSICESNPAGGFAIGTFVLVASSFPLLLLQSQHAHGCTCTREKRKRIEALENIIKSRHIYREIDSINSRMDAFQVELDESAAEQRAALTPLVPPRTPLSPVRIETSSVSRRRSEARRSGSSITVMSDTEEERPTVITPVTRDSEEANREIIVGSEQQVEEPGSESKPEPKSTEAEVSDAKKSDGTDVKGSS